MTPAGRAAKRALDITVSAAGLVALSPLFAAIAVVIKAASRGPVLYRAERVGLNGRLFTMHKFRSMHHDRVEHGARITAFGDTRVFRAGRFLRRSKLDELPQLWDVLRGAMSLVGPRPEDPDFVRRHYTPKMMETLQVRPGITSPGALFGTTHGEAMLDGDDPEVAYVERLLQTKLALERLYVERRSFRYDVVILRRTVATLAAIAAARTEFEEPPELDEIRRSRDPSALLASFAIADAAG